jgi:hypothetical protein
MRKTTDIWLVTYIRETGKISPDNWYKNEKGKTVFEFSIREETWKKLKKEFSKSDAIKWKYAIEQTKDLIY